MLWGDHASAPRPRGWTMKPVFFPQPLECTPPLRTTPRGALRPEGAEEGLEGLPLRDLLDAAEGSDSTSAAALGHFAQ